MRNKLRSTFMTMLAVAIILATSFVVNTSTANAVETRPGARFGQYDILLNDYETEQARRSFWAATVICWNSGLVGWATSLGVCQSMVTVCAARAYYPSPRKRAGITLAPYGAWCWKY